MRQLRLANFFVTGCMAASSLIATSGLVTAASPTNMQTPAPVIYLKDNLDEKDNLGYCIDTVGRGQSDRAHAHSCKPPNSRGGGGDVQFIHEAETGHIMSATYDDLCLEIVPISDDEVEFHLSSCENKPLQNFTFNKDTAELHLTDDYALCLGVGDTSRSAGPFMSRDLDLNLCEEFEPALNEWVIVSQ